MAALKVLQLATAGPLYGAERWILALLRNLDPARVESHVAVIDDLGGDEPPLLSAAREAGFATHRITCRGRIDGEAVRALRRLVEGQGFEILHTHGYKPDALALLAARGTGARTVSTPHGWTERPDWKLRLYEWADWAILGLFDAVAPLSPALRDGIARNPLAARKLHYIANGVDLTEIDAARASKGAPALAGLGPVIGYCGRLVPGKDLPTLLRAFARWNEPGARLVIVGEGPCRDELEALARQLGIAEATRFAGYRPDRLEWMAGFDRFVLPSLSEGIPRCLMEAMALEVPVVASDIAGNRNVVSHLETGLLFPPGDDAALADCLAQAMALPEESRQRADCARALVEARFSGRAMADAYARLFEGLATGRPVRSMAG